MESNHYETLDISPTATLQEIKQAYRRLVKKFHPDSLSETSDRQKIIEINAAYEVLGDPQQRKSYDQQLLNLYKREQANRNQRTAVSQNKYRQQRSTGQNADEQLEHWIQQVYMPVNRLLYRILSPLKAQIDELAADPFDDDLMEEFQNYLKECRDYLKVAQKTFQSVPNPPTVAGTAVNIYYCLNQLADGIDELELFTLNYDEHYLHTGQELFRIATGLRRQAQETIKSFA